jgi:hypothetical protein
MEYGCPKVPYRVHSSHSNHGVLKVTIKNAGAVLKVTIKNAGAH